MMIELERIQSEIEKLKEIIIALKKEGANKNLIHGLAYTNQYLHELLCKELCRKDESGNYVHEQPNQPLGQSWSKGTMCN